MPTKIETCKMTKLGLMKVKETNKEFWDMNEQRERMYTYSQTLVSPGIK